ncbi:MAG: hypothetical protein ACRC92_23925 [Peptostreptococcaceae bacterium]
MEKFLKDIKLNVIVSRFSEALVGMSIWVIIGTYDVPIYATVLKITQMFGKLISGHIEKTIAHKTATELCNMSFKTEMFKTFLYSLGHIILAFYFHVGITMVVMGNIYSGVNDAISTVYHDRVAETLYDKPKDRSTFRATMKIVGSNAHIFGLGLNIAVMTLSQTINYNQVLVIRILLAIHGVMGVLDLLVTLKERKSFKTYMKNYKGEI